MGEWKGGDTSVISSQNVQLYDVRSHPSLDTMTPLTRIGQGVETCFYITQLQGIHSLPVQPSMSNLQHKCPKFCY